MNKSETAIICEVEFQEGASPPVGALVPFLSEVARTVHIIACCVHLMMNSGPLLTASTLWRLQRSARDPPPRAFVPQVDSHAVVHVDEKRRTQYPARLKIELALGGPACRMLFALRGPSPLRAWEGSHPRWASRLSSLLCRRAPAQSYEKEKSGRLYPRCCAASDRSIKSRSTFSACRTMTVRCPASGIMC